MPSKRVVEEVARVASLRLDRAVESGQELLDDIDAWRHTKTLEVEFGLSADRMGWRAFVVKMEPPPKVEEWGIRFAEVANHFRSVLNTTLSRIAEIETGSVDTNIQFPIAKTRKDWNNQKRRIKNLPDRLQRLLYGTQPFVMKRGHGQTAAADVLAVLGWADNQAKHRAELVAKITPRALAHSFEMKYANPTTAMADADVRFVYGNDIKPGANLVVADSSPHRIDEIVTADLWFHDEVSFLDEEGKTTEVGKLLYEFLHKSLSELESLLAVWYDEAFDLNKITGATDFRPGAAFGRAAVDQLAGEPVWDRDLLHSSRFKELEARHIVDSALNLSGDAELLEAGGANHFVIE